ncbi:hypothetical protein B0T14DRAFT_570796 [Immersiella caudata]|uniref:Uncharacterized protein n=1 Tax=Immersiella caudata TaxID=314043 RepID=A0AA39U3B7_9PEZI|nr:hypothetical protein B0T14DRAFT_570796 [Immersiella caudata]
MIVATLLLLAVTGGVLGEPTRGRWHAPRETARAEERRKASDSISPTPTSSPGIVAMGLFRRQDDPDYVLPSDTCGFFDHIKELGFQFRCFTECETIMSLRAAPPASYTEYNCYRSGYGGIYGLQDYPPGGYSNANTSYIIVSP